MQKKQIQVGLGQLEAAASLVAELSTSFKFKKIADSYWFSRTTQSLSPVYEKLSKLKNQLIEDYSEKDEKGLIVSLPGGGIKFDPKRREEFDLRSRELYAIRETRNSFQIELAAIDGLELTPMDLLAPLGTWFYAPEDETPGAIKEEGEKAPSPNEIES